MLNQSGKHGLLKHHAIARRAASELALRDRSQAKLAMARGAEYTDGFSCKYTAFVKPSLACRYGSTRYLVAVGSLCVHSNSRSRLKNGTIESYFTATVVAELQTQIRCQKRPERSI
jgi:hypothetical protein